MTSSGDLHPAHGGRFVAVRSSLDPLSYEVEVLLPEGERATATLRWLEGTTVLEPALPEPWTQTEMLKLARVLGRTKQERMTRWRPKPERG